jgi:hypothetical protein
MSADGSWKVGDVGERVKLCMCAIVYGTVTIVSLQKPNILEWR